jgi:hypothetical protein
MKCNSINILILKIFNKFIGVTYYIQEAGPGPALGKSALKINEK